VRYAGAATDFNPIHYSEHFARQVGLPGVIAHGMLTMGAALRVVTNWVGDPSRVTSYFVRFTRPVAVPDDPDGVEVEFSASVVAIDGSLVTIGIEAICNGQRVLGAARAEVDLGIRVPHADHGAGHAP
jgi:acyl dehydratase